jgi:hypothetical protein
MLCVGHVVTSVPELFWTMGHLLHGLSLVDHQNIKRNIFRIWNGMRMKFTGSQRLHPHDF